MNSVPAVEDIPTAFARDGYYLARGVYAGPRLAALEADFDQIVRQLVRNGDDLNARWTGEMVDAVGGGDTSLIHTHNVQRYSAEWLHAFLDDRFLSVARAILGPDVVLHHSKLFQKPPRAGAPFPIHQDWWYFPTAKDRMIAATIFLTEADDSSGGFRVYPGSHRLGRLGESSGLQRSESLRAYPLAAATPIDARPGDVLFFSYLTLHGSSANRSERIRKTVLVQMYDGSDEVLANADVNHVNERLVLSGRNHRMNRDLAAEKPRRGDPSPRASGSG
jgi:ectoine hydroxylase-related dioxygenase (phytanoyl-CoA dioxygenase family)